MEIFAEVHRDGLLEAAEARRQLKAATRTGEMDRVAHQPRSGAIGRGLAWLARLVRPGRHAAAS